MITKDLILIQSEPTDQKWANWSKVSQLIKSEPTDQKLANWSKVSQLIKSEPTDQKWANWSKVSRLIKSEPTDQKWANISDDWYTCRSLSVFLLQDQQWTRGQKTLLMLWWHTTCSAVMWRACLVHCWYNYTAWPSTMIMPYSYSYSTHVTQPTVWEATNVIFRKRRLEMEDDVFYFRHSFLPAYQDLHTR